MAITQAQLLQQTLQASVRARQQQAQVVAQQKALEAQRKAQVAVQVGVAPSPKQQAYTRLNEILSEAISRGQKTLKGSQITAVREAFSRAGLNPNEAEKLYKRGMTAPGTAYAGAKAGMTGGVYFKEFKFEEGKGYVYTPTPTPTPTVVAPSTFVGPLRPGETRAEPTPTYPSTFVGPLRPGETRAPPPTPTRVYPSTFVGPLRPGETRAPPPTPTYPSTFVGPLRPGETRAPPPTPTPGVPSFLQPPQFKTPAQREFYQRTVVAPREQLKFEQQRYQDLGYTMQESKSLAQESVARGGITFTPETAERIIFKSSLTPIGEKVIPIVEKVLDMPVFGVGPIGFGPSWRELPGEVVEKGKKVITKFAEVPIIKKVLEAPIAQYEPTEYEDPFGFKIKEMEAPGEIITVRDIGVGIGKGTKEFAKEYGKGVGEIYSKIPEKLRPSLIIPGKEKEYYEVVELYKAGEITAEEANRRGRELTTDVTPEQVAKGAEVVLGIGTYAVASAIPGALPILLASDVIAAQDDYQNASKLAQKEGEKALKEYRKLPVEEGFEEISDEEYLNTVVPQFETEIRNQALMAMGISGAFLAGGALWKVGKALSKFVPRTKFTFGGRKLSQVKYDKKMKELLEGEIYKTKVSKDIFKIRGEREAWGAPQTGSVFGGKGFSQEVIGSAGKIEVSTFADDLFKNFKIFKTKQDAIKFVEGMSKIKTRSADVFTKQAAFAQKIDPLTGKLVGKMYKVGELPKVGKEWITTGDSWSLSSSWKIRGVDKSIVFNYQLGSQGRPINIGLQINTIPKNSKYAEMMFYKAGKKGAYNLKDRTIAKISKGDVFKKGDVFRDISQSEFRRIKFDKRRLTQYEIIDDLVNVPSKTELKNLFDAGKKIERQEVIRELTLSGYDINVRSVITDKQALGAVTFGKKYDVKILGAGKKEASWFEAAKDLDEPIKFFKKTPFEKTFGAQPVTDTGPSVLTLEQVKVLELPTPTLIISPPKIKPPIVRVSKVIQPPPVSIEAPLMVGGLGLKEVPYAGLGLYERTEPEPFFGELLAITKDGIIEPAKVEVRTDVLLGAKPIVYLGVGPKIISGLKPLVDIREITKLKTELKTILTPAFAPAVIPKVREVVKVSQFPVLRPKLVEKLKAVQQLVTPTIVTPMMAPRLRPRPKPKKPVIKIPFPLLEVPRRPRIRRPPKEPTPELGYGIEIKRKGKWERAKIPYAFATKEGASAVAMEKVVKEAAASYRLVESFKPVKKTRKRPTALQKIMFRPGKQKGVIVQKKLLRITTPGEVRQISLKGAAARRGVSPWGLEKKKKVIKKKSKLKKKGGRKK